MSMPRDYHEYVIGLSDVDLRTELSRYLPHSPAPVTSTTRGVLERQLEKFLSAESGVMDDYRSGSHSFQDEPNLSSSPEVIPAPSNTSQSHRVEPEEDEDDNYIMVHTPSSGNGASVSIGSPRTLNSHDSDSGICSPGGTNTTNHTASEYGLPEYRRRPLHSGQRDWQTPNGRHPMSATLHNASPTPRPRSTLTWLLAIAVAVGFVYLLLHLDPLSTNPVPEISHNEP